MNVILPTREPELMQVYDQLDRDGIAMIPGFVDASDFARMNGFVDAAIAKSPGEYVGFTTAEGVAGSSLDEIGTSHRLRSLAEGVYEHLSGRAAPDTGFYQVLRCLTGPSASEHSHIYHYDSYMVTILIPIRIPTKGKTGDFLLIPNTRRVRSRYLVNALDKILLDNPLTQRVLRFLGQRNLPPIRRVKLVPGNAYVFSGYRTIHTNDTCDPDGLRVTALFHYANPHEGARKKR